LSFANNLLQARLAEEQERARAAAAAAPGT
ncbi:MAG: hypothetical protein JWO90_375, partial [Solirubrobacterales bacterium]|nr:hypothetical protein [Solirubrobacterales bacterium]